MYQSTKQSMLCFQAHIVKLRSRFVKANEHLLDDMMVPRLQTWHRLTASWLSSITATVRDTKAVNVLLRKSFAICTN